MRKNFRQSALHHHLTSRAPASRPRVFAPPRALAASEKLEAARKRAAESKVVEIPLKKKQA